MSEELTMSKIESCHYNPRVLLLSLGAAIVIIFAAFAEKGFAKGSGPRIGLALVQAIATAFVIVVTVGSIRRLDEMQQRIQLEALAFSFAGTGMLAAGYGFLNDAGLPAIDWATVVWPVMVGLWVLGFAVASRRYR